LLVAKYAAPSSSKPAIHWPALDRVSEYPFTLFNAPSGYLQANNLASELNRQEHNLLWLRIDEQDRDPATFLLSLIDSVRHLRPEFGSSTLLQMQRAPGPIAGWPPLYSLLAQELAETLPESSALVLEHVHVLMESQPTLALLSSHLLAHLPGIFPCILISHKSLPSGAIPQQVNLLGRNDLRLDSQTAFYLADSANAELSGKAVQRCITLLDGKSVPFAGMINACNVLGPEFIERLLNSARNERQLLYMVARAWLAAVTTGNLRALAMTMDLEYSHPQLTQAVLGIYTTPDGPWLQPLIDHWSRIWNMWKSPLRSTLKLEPYPNIAAILRTADYFLKQGAIETAMRLYFEAQDFGSAARVLSKRADRMLNLGQWTTLGSWLKRLPNEVLYSWPDLVYIQGEIYAASQRPQEARHTFSAASRLYTTRKNPDGACKSLLAEATLAAWAGEPDRAQACALSANALAQSIGSGWYQAWASWQLGCLAASMNKLEDALAYFSKAADVVDNPLAKEIFYQAEMMAQRQLELRTRREYHRQKYLDMEQSEKNAHELLSSLLNTQPDNLSAFLSQIGWLQTPLTLKLNTSFFTQLDAQTGEDPGFWRKMLSLFGLLRSSGSPEVERLDSDFTSMGFTSLADGLNWDRPTLTSRTLHPQDIPFPEIPPPRVTTPPLKPLSKTEKTVAGEEIHPTTGILLTVSTLGNFSLSINDTVMQRLPSTRGLSVLKYLLINHKQKTPREVLMDTFWQDSDPDSARNNLNVSLHSLRSALREITETPVVIFEKGNYFLNPDLRIWIDVEEFEDQLHAGQQLESAGDLSNAVRKYEVATSLYQGDFLEEDPYEEWPVLTREHLRVSYMETLDRLSQIKFDMGNYSACVALCQKMLERDNCREDAHRLLMRCFSRQGQQHLALRQYQACVEALRTELDVDPEPATVQLAEHIRHHENV
jgi:DNA-binding SARP family transcriptional activator